MKFEIEVPDDYLANVICSGIESGIAYWGRSNKFTKLPTSIGGSAMADYYQPLVGGSIEFLEWRSAEGEKFKSHSLTKENLIRGIQVILDKYPHHAGAVLGDQNRQDAITGDVLIQCSLFGDLVYSD